MKTPLDQGWRQWIAEQRLRNCALPSMLQTMVSAGLDATESARAIAEIEADPIFLGARRYQQLHVKLQSVVANLQKLWEFDPQYGQVTKMAEPGLDEFIWRFVIGCRPVVLTGVAADWPALQRWSPADLKARFGQLDVEIQAGRDADALFERNKLAHRQRTRLDAYVDRVLASGPTNDHYLTANNEVLRNSGFAPLLQDIGTLPRLCDPARLAHESSFWFGPAGTLTPLHHDTIMLFHTQIVGRKRWRLVSPLQTPRVYNHFDVYSSVNLPAPDLAAQPDFVGVQVLDVVVEPGETIFLPLGWWHEVSSLDVSLSFSYSNLRVPNQFGYQNPQIANW